MKFISLPNPPFLIVVFPLPLHPFFFFWFPLLSLGTPPTFPVQFLPAPPFIFSLFESALVCKLNNTATPAFQPKAGAFFLQEGPLFSFPRFGPSFDQLGFCLGNTTVVENTPAVPSHCVFELLVTLSHFRL